MNKIRILKPFLNYKEGDVLMLEDISFLLPSYYQLMDTGYNVGDVVGIYDRDVFYYINSVNENTYTCTLYTRSDFTRNVPLSKTNPYLYLVTPKLFESIMKDLCLNLGYTAGSFVLRSPKMMESEFTAGSTAIACIRDFGYSYSADADLQEFVFRGILIWYKDEWASKIEPFKIGTEYAIVVDGTLSVKCKEIHFEDLCELIRIMTKYNINTIYQNDLNIYIDLNTLVKLKRYCEGKVRV